MQYSNKDIFIIAAPGCMGAAPDSLEAIIAGSEAGATGFGLELDVTEDGIVVLSGRGGFIRHDGSSFALSECGFGEARDQFPKIVTVGQGIELVKSCAGKLCIHTKNVRISAPVKLALTHADYVSESYFVDLSIPEAARLAKVHPTLQFMGDVFEPPQNEGALLRSARDAGLFGLRVAPGILHERFCEDARTAGLFLASTECHDEPMLERLIALGVNFIETLRPDLAFSKLPQPETPETPQERVPLF